MTASAPSSNGAARRGRCQPQQRRGGRVHPVQALAYETPPCSACFYGERLPSQRKFNFPGAPRPAVVPEHLRVHLTVASIKAIAADHGRSCAAFLFVAPAQLRPAPAAAPPVPPTPPPLVPAPAPATDGAAAASAEGTSTAADVHAAGNAGNHVASADECLLSCNPDDDFVGNDDVELFVN